MSWTCYSCSHVNPNSADTCQECGGTVAAPRNFYIQWVFGGALFFLVTYILGTFVGATLIEFMVAPAEPEVLVQAQTMGVQAKTMNDLQPAEVESAKLALILSAKQQMSPFLSGLVYWFLPTLLFVLCGAIVGFISDGKTIWEAALGSAIGQSAGFAILRYAFDAEISWLALAVGLPIGFALAILGAWQGEKIQERREQAV